MLSTRRMFLAQTATVLATSPLLCAAGQASAAVEWPVLGFIKPFQKLSYTEIADISSEVGWEGIECPVRKGGTIEPSKVEEELPRLVEALRKNQSEISIIATDIDDAEDALTGKVLRAAQKLGIKRYRLKHLYYDLTQPIDTQLTGFKAKLRDLAELNRELGLQGTFQNHSGKNYVGAPVWDIWAMLREVDPKYLAAYLDIGHATIEGGYSWPIQARLIRALLGVVSVKDFTWKQNASRKRWDAEWCPIGEGAVQSDFFSYLKSSNWSGPVCQHYEYELGEGRQMIQALKKDQAALKKWLQA
jgi:sugar phosphate isomerase/epimerase